LGANSLCNRFISVAGRGGAAQIAARNPDAVRAAKRVLNNSGLVDVATGLAEEASAMQGLLGTPNQLEAISAQFEGRPPKFLD
jgi:enoyl-CoA hydratase/carnithine racemase